RNGRRGPRTENADSLRDATNELICAGSKGQPVACSTPGTDKVPYRLNVRVDQQCQERLHCDEVNVADVEGRVLAKEARARKRIADLEVQLSPTALAEAAALLETERPGTRSTL